ncbi:MAG TPA: tRNA preQ1(34) S-adenosylmethionine ribosyltransferase-isomerase QueA [Candidatus Acidoferrales bacterium]|nr:tRNA preQ1(34) S-adenosylmethionine ribosyltransferase-isomerase QueA [Candidatus Acidoferrales bacterium]
MRLSDFDYELPTDRIAQRPAEERDASRMMVLSREDRTRQDRAFRELPDLLRGDELIVVNDARVLPARLFGRRRGARAQPPGRRRRGHLTSEIEVLLTRQLEPGVWEALVRPGRKIGVGERIFFEDGAGGRLEAEVIARGEYGARRLRFPDAGDLAALMDCAGHIPLPPYIAREDAPEDRERYQTIFARQPGAVAAPTAGLHFTPAVLERLRARGIEICTLTLDVGPGTFQPVRTEEVERHRMQPEAYEIPEATAAAICRAQAAGRPVLAVGTTVVRALESAARRAMAARGAGRNSSAAPVAAGAGEADVYLYPGAEFLMVNQLLTNFHLPKSTLLLLVCGFAGRDFVLDAYGHAVEAGYRFYSYGDCMLIR